MEYDNYLENGYFVADTGLADHISNIRKKSIEIFNLASSLNGFGSITSDADVIALYNNPETKHIWDLAYQQLRYLPEVMGLFDKTEFKSLALKCGMKFPAHCMYTMMRMDMPFGDKYNFDVHQDYPYNLGSLNSIVIWVPLQEIDNEIGPLTVYPGSHLNGHIDCNDIGIIENYQNDKQIEAPMKLGQALVFSQFLAHKSGKNRSDRIRLAIQIRINDLAEVHYAKRGMYINKEVRSKTLSVDYDTKFPIS